MRGLKATAYHEAGHAVVSALLRRGLHRVTIVADAAAETLGHAQSARLGRPEAFRPDIGTTPRQRRALDAAVLVSLAGMVAEEEAGASPRAIARGAQQDVRNALDIASALLSSEEEVETYVEWRRVAVRGLLRRYWRAVEAVAAALLQHRTLSGPRVRQFIRETMGIEKLATETRW